MSLLEALQAVVLGIVEGLTEFLPISSTGHLIIASKWIGFDGYAGVNTFLVAIQAGAIFAVCWYYRTLIWNILRNLFTSGEEQRLAINTIIAFVPAVAVGLCFADFIQTHFFNIGTVVVMLILGGIVLLWIERRASRPDYRPRVKEMKDLTYAQAFGVGVAQCFAMIPGTSRSGSTIIGGLLLGLSRKAATEFSFFLAIPTILGASVYDLWKSRETLLQSDLSVEIFLIGLVVSFVSALAVVKWLIGFVSHHDYRPFGWYRIIFGLLLLAGWFAGIVTF